MNSKQAHKKLKEINTQRNLIGVGGFKDSRRTRCEQNEKLNTAITEINQATDKAKMEAQND